MSVRTPSCQLISIHALREEGDWPQRCRQRSSSYFYPRPPRGGRRLNISFRDALREFLSTPSARRATRILQRKLPNDRRFLSTPSARRATVPFRRTKSSWIFLSTPSARRATGIYAGITNSKGISIHALREEGDRSLAWAINNRLLFLSTPSARRATPGFFRSHPARIPISIHALREEGDSRAQDGFYGTEEISIHALREEGDSLQVHQRVHPAAISIHALREEGDSSGRRCSRFSHRFLSTPSARRATWHCRPALRRQEHFYPRPPRGGRLFSASSSSVSSYFYPRPPRGGRRGWRCQPLGCPQISIHALREEGDLLSSLLSAPFWDFYPRPPRGGRREASFRGCPWRIYFYPRPPRGGRHQFHALSAEVVVISIHALREEGDHGRSSTVP